MTEQGPFANRRIADVEQVEVARDLGAASSYGSAIDQRASDAYR